METLLTILHVLVSIFMIGAILLQSGKGGGMGAAFGGGGAVFGGRGAGGFLAKLTTGAAVIFFLTSLSLSMLSSQRSSVVLDAADSGEIATDAQEIPSGDEDESVEATKADEAEENQAAQADVGDANDTADEAAVVDSEPSNNAADTAAVSGDSDNVDDATSQTAE